MTDLAGRAAAGDRAAMEALLLEAQAVAWRFSRTVCGHTEDAEDVMQEALVQTYRFVSRLRDVRVVPPVAVPHGPERVPDVATQAR